MVDYTSASSPSSGFSKLPSSAAISSPYALLPANSQVAAIGDSIAGGNSFATSTYTKQYVKGYVNWAAFFGRQRWTFDHEDNFGVPGEDSGEVNKRVKTMLQTTKAGTIIVDCLTNDAPHNVTLAASKINYQNIINKIRAAGRIVVLVTPRPRDITAVGLTLTAQQYRDHLARRDHVLGLHNPGNGVYVVDMWRYLANPASTNGAMKTGFTYDGLHPSQMGAYWGGMALAELFGIGRNPGLFPFRDVLVAQNSDVWNAAYPRGCVNQNPMMQAGASAATGYTVGGGAGVTATGSKVSPAGGRTDIQQIVLSGTASSSADVFDFYQTITPGNLAINDVVRGYAEIDYDSISGLTSHGLVLVDTGDFSKIAGFLVDSTEINALQMLNVAMSGVMRTPKFKLTSTALRFGMKGRTINTVAVTGTYRVGAMSLRKVV